MPTPADTNLHVTNCGLDLKKKEQAFRKSRGSLSLGQLLIDDDHLPSGVSRWWRRSVADPDRSQASVPSLTWATVVIE